MGPVGLASSFQLCIPLVKLKPASSLLNHFCSHTPVIHQETTELHLKRGKSHSNVPSLCSHSPYPVPSPFSTSLLFSAPFPNSFISSNKTCFELLSVKGKTTMAAVGIRGEAQSSRPGLASFGQELFFQILFFASLH